MKEEYFCGIDVSKESFSVAVKNEQFLAEDQKFSMDKAGFERLHRLLTPYQGKLLVGMESTGIYHQNLFYFLQKQGYNATVVNPYKLKQFFKFVTDKPTKTDQKDAKVICKFVEYQKESKNPIPEEERYRLRYLVREKESLTQQMAKTKSEIRRILVLVFPELERQAPVLSNGLLSLLKVFPSAKEISQTPEKRFLQKAERLLPDRGRKPSLTAKEIYQLATTSIAHHFPMYEKLLLMKIETLEWLTQQRKNISALIQEMAEKLFQREIEILTSIPGVGKESAISFMSEIVDISRFDDWRKLVGFCGLDPVIKQSGNYQAVWKISKRGNRHARRSLFIMGGCVKRSCPYFRDYYLKKRDEGKSYTEAVIATSTKLLRTIYALLKENRRFI